MNQRRAVIATITALIALLLLAGIPLSGSAASNLLGAHAIYGYVFYDLNLNHVMDAGEPPLAGARVSLDGTQTATTGADGYYYFGSLSAGHHHLTETNPQPFPVSTTPDSVEFDMPAAGATLCQDFGDHLWLAPEWVNFYGTQSYLGCESLPVGSIVRAYDPQDVLCGIFVTTVAGQYGLMPVRRDDPSTPGDEGAMPGDLIHFTVNGAPALPSGPDLPVWSGNGQRQHVELNVPATPATPVLAASKGDYLDKVRVTWDAVAGATRYVLYRSTSLDFSAAIQIADLAGTTYDDTAVDEEVTYWYWVRACSCDGFCSPFSDPDVGWRAAEPWHREDVDNWRVDFDLNWDCCGLVIKPGADRIRVHFAEIHLGPGDHLRTSAGDDWVGVDLVDVTSSVMPGTSIEICLESDDEGTGYFIIDYIEYQGKNCTGPAYHAGALFFSTDPPAAPTGVSASDGTYTDRVRVTWNAVTGAVGYRVYRSAVNDPTQAALIGVTTDTWFDDMSAAPCAIYWYWVKAYRCAGTSPFSNGDSGYASAATPNLLEPRDGFASCNPTPTFRWTGSAGACYRLQVATDEAFNALVIDETVCDLEFTPAAALPDGTYFWRVRPEGSCSSELAWSEVRSFSVASVPAPDAPALIAPDNGAVLCDTTPTLSWNAVGGAVSYEVEIDGSVVATIAGTEYTPAPLSLGVHTWRVQATNFCGRSGAWSAQWTFEIGAALDAPALIAPANGSSTCDTTPTFQWAAVARASGYEIQIDAGAAIAVAGTEFTPATALTLGGHTWRVRATGECGAGPWSATWTLTILAGAAPATLIAPANGAVLCSTPTFEWQGSITCTLQVDDDPGFGSPVPNPPANLVPGTYYWRVRCTANCGDSTSPVWTFTIAQAPAAPILIAPPNGGTTGHWPTFRWNPVNGATLYEIQIDDDASFASPIRSATITETTYVPDVALEIAWYHWRVRASNACGVGPWSTAWTFYDPEPCDQAVQNPGFETPGGWVPAGLVPGRYSDAEKHAGSWSGLVGIAPPAADMYAFSSLSQRVTIPSDASSATLHFWHKSFAEAPHLSDKDDYAWAGFAPGQEITRQDADTLAAANAKASWASQDWQFCLIRYGNAGQFAVLMATNSNAGAWEEQSFDLSPWKGQQIYVHFEVRNDGVGGRSWMYVDDVTVDICRAGATTPTPTRTPTSTYTPTPTRTPTPTATPACSVRPSNVWVNIFGRLSTFNGAPLHAGQVVQALDAGGTQAGCYVVQSDGQYGVMPVYGDDPETAEDEGLAPGEALRLKVDGQDAVILGPDADTWTEHGAMLRLELAVGGSLTRQITLHAGWNLFSFDVMPLNTATAAVLAPIAGQFSRVLGSTCAEGALSYYPSLPAELNTLRELDPYHAYWIYMNNAATLSISGPEVPDSVPIGLCARWNTVSYLPNAPLPAGSALASIAGQFSSVLGFDQGALAYYPDLPPGMNSLQSMAPGLGYWIRPTADATLTYPPAGLGLLAFAQAQNEPAPTGVTPTNRWADAYSLRSTFGGAPVPLGAVIEAFDPDGTLVGRTVVREAGRFGLMPIYGDDPATAEDEGARPGDRLSFTINGVPAAPARGQTFWRGERTLMRLDLHTERIDW